MPRSAKCRKVCYLPKVLEFFPEQGADEKPPVRLIVDEYEAIRLIDGLSQEQCSEFMQVAGTTVQRVYESARRKMADVLVDGLPLRIEGGNFCLCNGQSEKCGHDGCFKHRYHRQYEKAKGKNILRIAVTYKNGDFQHFGHTAQFKVYDVQEGKVIASEVIDTNGNGHGALAGGLTALNAQVLICGGVGGGAQMALAAAGIQLYGGVSGNTDAAVDAFVAGKLEFNPNVKCDHHEHHGEGHNCGNHGCGSYSCGQH